MSGSDHGRWKESIAAYAVGALGADEVAELERHLESCQDCRAELRWLQPAVDLLPESVERFEPSPELRGRILDQARSESGTASSKREPRRFRVGWRPLAGLATIALVAALAGYAIGGGGSAEQGTTTVAAGKPPAVTAKLVMEGDSGTLRLANVDSMPEDKVLEAWVEREGEVEPVRGLFVPDREGRATTTIPDMHGVEAVMVTTEPQGGSDSPTGTPMVTARIEPG